MPVSNYRRLTWRSRRPTRIALAVPRTTLLFGDDHILKVDSTLFAESYKRFFFRDIQSITIKTNRRREIWNIVLGPLLAILVLERLLDTGAGNALAATVTITALLSAVLLVINNLCGATCDVRIQTAVQADTLPPLSRVKRANQALELIRPLIIQAQGQLTPEETLARVRELAAPPVPKPAPTGPLNL